MPPPEPPNGLSPTERRVWTRNHNNALRAYMSHAGYPDVIASTLDWHMWFFHDGDGFWTHHRFSIPNVAKWVLGFIQDCLGWRRGLRWDTPPSAAYIGSMEQALQTLVAHFGFPLETAALVVGAGDAPDVRTAKRVDAAKRLMRLLWMHDMDMQGNGTHHGQAFDDLRGVSRAMIAWFEHMHLNNPLPP